jgi:FAD/FMN-containing dehydrogenase
MAETIARPKPADVSRFREAFGGEVITPDDGGYDEARRVWNAMIDKRPAVVARPTSLADVVAAIRFGREHELVIAIRGGGHSMAGHSTCDGGIVIDLSRMRGVTVDPGRQTARANGGALLSELDRAGQEHGLVCPVGVVGHTGVAGLTLGGGMGRLQRHWGFTIDNLRAVDMVTADGRHVRASENENPELFWGMRGAGANFGVVTALEYQLHPFGPDINRGFHLYPATRVHELWAMFLEWAPTAPDHVMATFNFIRGLPAEDFPPELAGEPVIGIGVSHSGAVESVEQDLAPLRSIAPPTTGSMDAQPYLEVQTGNDEAMAWGHRVYTKGAFTNNLSRETLDALVDHIATVEGDDSIAIWAQGGAIGRLPEDAMAFTGRSANFEIDAESFWDDPAEDDRHLAASRRAMAIVEPDSTTGQYVNSVSDVGANAAQAVYGDAKQDRLVALKRAWDPDNVFRLNHNIRP